MLSQDSRTVEAGYKKNLLRFHIDNTMVDIRAVFRSVEAIREQMGNYLKIDCAGICVEIEIFTDREEWIEHHTYVSQGDMPSWIQGDSGRIIRIVTDENKVAGLDDLLLIIAHETVHHILHHHAGDCVPAWLDEGLALFLSQELPDNYQALLAEKLGDGGVVPFEMLNESFCGFDRKLQALAYAQSYTMIAHIVDTHGWEMVTALVGAVSRNESLDRALNGFGLNFYLLEKQWIGTVNGL